MQYRKEINPKFLNDYLDYREIIENLSETTIYSENINIRAYLKFIYAYKKLKDKNKYYELKDISFLDVNILEQVNMIDMLEYLKFLIEDLKLGEQTRYDRICIIRIFYKYMHTKMHYISNNQFVNLEVPKYKVKEVVYMTKEESIKLLNSPFQNNTKYAIRDYCILAVFLNTGLRRAELVNALLSNLDLDRRELKVLGKGNKERTVPLNDICYNALQEYLKVRDDSKCLLNERDYLFISDKNRHFSLNGLYEIVKKYIKLCDLENKKFAVHTLRHTSATLLYKNGAGLREIQKLLGHTNVSTTQRYTHIDMDDVRNAVNKNPLNLEKVS